MKQAFPIIELFLDFFSGNLYAVVRFYDVIYIRKSLFQHVDVTKDPLCICPGLNLSWSGVD